MSDYLEKQKDKIEKYIKSAKYTPLKPEELAVVISVSPEHMPVYYEVIGSLIEEGRIIKTKKGSLMAPEKLNIIKGVFTGNIKGFGFVSAEGRKEDVFVPADYTASAMHKDTVLCRITHESSDGVRAEGEIIRVLRRGMKEIVGTFDAVRNFGFVVPDDKKIAQRIFVPQSSSLGAVSGHKVVCVITKYQNAEKGPEGKIKEILGHINEPGVDILAIAKQYSLRTSFPEDVIAEAEATESEIKESELSGREDFRGLLTVTIDGADAKDLDDAVSLENISEGFRLYVHIADVSHYVREGSPLDKEALLRGTSVYMADRVLPMLPPRLSNGICSLNPNCDRLTLSVVMDIDKNGELLSERICKSVINSDRRLTYDVVNEILTQKTPELADEYKDCAEMLEGMARLRDILLEKRVRRGSINFDFPEAKVLLDEEGKPAEIKLSERNSATSLIEEFMLMANETVAEEYFWAELPFVYRTHERPDEEKMKELSEFVRGFGFKIKGKSEAHPKAVQKLLDDIKGSEYENIISRVTLRSMKQARYTPENIGHFGLAAKYYSHFTSPIRRYPDLQIHRIIKENLEGINEARIEHYKKILPEVCKEASLAERNAEAAERDSVELKKVEYMSEKIGMVFTGIISGVTQRGFYVELPNTVEGMVSVMDMTDDYYEYSKTKRLLYGVRGGKTYRLGDEVKVELARTSPEFKTIDFVIFDEGREAKVSKKTAASAFKQGKKGKSLKKKR